MHGRNTAFHDLSPLFVHPTSARWAEQIRCTIVDISFRSVHTRWQCTDMHDPAGISFFLLQKIPHEQQAMVRRICVPRLRDRIFATKLMA